MSLAGLLPFVNKNGHPAGLRRFHEKHLQLWNFDAPLEEAMTVVFMAGKLFKEIERDLTSVGDEEWRVVAEPDRTGIMKFQESSCVGEATTRVAETLGSAEKVKPRWNRNELELRLDNEVICEIASNAPNQIEILNSFEAAGWPDENIKIGDFTTQQLSQAFKILRKKTSRLTFGVRFDRAYWRYLGNPGPVQDPCKSTTPYLQNCQQDAQSTHIDV